MKGARLILPGCTGFHTRHPEWGEFEVLDIEHYRVVCLSLTRPSDPAVYIPLRDFEILSFPK